MKYLSQQFLLRFHDPFIISHLDSYKIFAGVILPSNISVFQIIQLFFWKQTSDYVPCLSGSLFSVVENFEYMPFIHHGIFIFPHPCCVRPCQYLTEYFITPSGMFFIYFLYRQRVPPSKAGPFGLPEPFRWGCFSLHSGCLLLCLLRPLVIYILSQAIDLISQGCGPGNIK